MASPSISACRCPDSPIGFSKDPVIKAESIWTGLVLGRANTFAQRKGPAVSLRNQEGEWRLGL